MSTLPPLGEAAHAAAETIRTTPSGRPVQILAAGTVDGIAAAAVAAHAVRRLGRTFHVRFLDPDQLGRAAFPEADAEDLFLLLGWGSAAAPKLAKLPCRVVALDPSEEGDPAVPAPNVAWVRPDGLGLRAPRDVAAATMALALALALDPRNWDLAAPALAGALAECPAPPELAGWNAEVLHEAVRRGDVALEPRLNFDDAPLGELASALPMPWRALWGGDGPSWSDLLRRLSLAPQARLHSLDQHDQQRLAAAMALVHLRAGLDPSDLAMLVDLHPVWVRTGSLPFRRISTLVRAAAHRDEAALALAFLLGDASALDQLEALAAPAATKVTA